MDLLIGVYPQRQIHVLFEMEGSMSELSRVADGINRQFKKGTVANTLTFFRAGTILIALPLMFFGYEWALFVLVVCAAVSDAEGYYARYTKTTTELGRVADPLADKVFTDTMLLAGFLPNMDIGLMALLVLTIGYDIDNTSRRLGDIVRGCIGERSERGSTPVTLLSKWKTTALYVLVILLYCPLTLHTVPSSTVHLFIALSIALFGAAWWHNRRDTVLAWFA